MFSDLSKHITSWMEPNTKKQQEPNSTSTENNSGNTNSSEAKKDSSTTKEMLLKMRNEIDGWLGITKIAKDEEGVISEQPRLVDDDEETITLVKPTEKMPMEQKVNDNNLNKNSNDPVPEKSDITPEKKEVSDKPLSATKSFGNMLFSAFNIASSKIKKSVEDSTLFLNEFIKEQDSYINKKRTTDAAVPPWIGYANEDALKEECLNLSNDKRNFVRNPPSGVEFNFDYDISYPVALATMAEDPKLEKMRFELVPKAITEERFWRNYFYRVSLIREAHEQFHINEENKKNAINNQQEKMDSDSLNLDKFEDASSDVNQIEKDVKRFNIQERTEEEWEKELEEELEDYEKTAGKVEIKNTGSVNDIDAILNEKENI